jgi:hypothetical protein
VARTEKSGTILPRGGLAAPNLADDEERHTMVLEVSMRLWSTRPRRPLVKGRRGRLHTRGGSFLQNNRLVDGL